MIRDLLNKKVHVTHPMIAFYWNERSKCLCIYTKCIEPRKVKAYLPVYQRLSEPSPQFLNCEEKIFGLNKGYPVLYLDNPTSRFYTLPKK